MTLLKRINRYVNFFEKLEEKEKVDDPFEVIVENYLLSSDKERVTMILKMSEENRERIQTLIDGGLL